MELFPKPPSITPPDEKEKWPAGFVTDEELTQKTIINVKGFGAKGNGITDDTAAIQAAIDAANAAGGGIVFLPQGNYIISSPLLVPLNGKIILQGVGANATIIVKNTNTIGTSPSRKARSGTVTDSYAVDSIISIDHADDAYNYYSSIKDMTLKSSAPAHVDYAIYSPRTTHLTIENVQIINCKYGYYTFETWMATITGFTALNCISVLKWADDGSGSTTGTSLTATRVWANTASGSAFDFFGLKYSVLNGCGADHVTLTNSAQAVYFFQTCTAVTLNGCGAEDVTGQVLYASSSKLIVNCMCTYDIDGLSAGTTGYLYFNNGSSVMLNECSFAPFGIAGTSFDIVIQRGAQVISNHSILPTGGKTFKSYSGDSVMIVINANGVTCKTKIDDYRDGIISNGKRIFWGTAAPTTGTWNAGDIILNSAPAAGGYIGWVCVTTGTPGTWKSFGTISA